MIQILRNIKMEKIWKNNKDKNTTKTRTKQCDKNNNNTPKQKKQN